MSGSGSARRFLFAPGAGAPSSSRWMQAWAERLRTLGSVSCFDYPYQRAGRKSPDRPAVLISAHRAELERCQAEHRGPVVLVGKSMGGRIGCHVTVEVAQANAPEPHALVCLGYPLVAPGGAVRDEVLLQLGRPILFVQGTRDAMCPLDRLEQVRARMQAAHELYVVDGGDHSLQVSARALRSQGLSQAAVDEGVLGAIASFVERWA